MLRGDLHLESQPDPPPLRWITTPAVPGVITLMLPHLNLHARPPQLRALADLIAEALERAPASSGEGGPRGPGR